MPFCDFFSCQLHFCSFIGVSDVLYAQILSFRFESFRCTKSRDLRNIIIFQAVVAYWIAYVLGNLNNTKKDSGILIQEDIKDGEIDGQIRVHMADTFIQNLQGIHGLYFISTLCISMASMTIVIKCNAMIYHTRNSSLKIKSTSI